MTVMLTIPKHDAPAAEWDAWLAKYETWPSEVSPPHSGYRDGISYSFEYLEQPIAYSAYPYPPDDIQQRLRAATARITAGNNERNEAASEAAFQRAAAERAARIAARGAMTMDQLAVALRMSKFPADATHILSDDDKEIWLATNTSHGRAHQQVRITLAPWGVARYVVINEGGEKPLRHAKITVEDGVIRFPDSSWAAIVQDPSAPKPAYYFLERCPGGYIVPVGLAVGDILVWGSKDKKGRKFGPYDRLVYDVSDTAVRAIRCDYVTARRVRKLLLA